MKTHIDNTIEEIKKEFEEVTGFSADNFGSLFELIKAESKRYADERVGAVLKEIRDGLEDHLESVYLESMVRVLDNLELRIHLNQNTESEKEGE